MADEMERVSSCSAPLSPLTETLLIEAIAWAARSAGWDVPRPLIVAAVKMVLVGAAEIDYRTVARAMRKLGFPDLAGPVFSYFEETVEEAVAEVECPESGDTIILDAGNGTYFCPDCGQDIEVEDGEATHAYELACPVEDEVFWVGPEEGTYECPQCGMEVIVKDGDAQHEDVPATGCPVSGDTIHMTRGDGRYVCPDCGDEIFVKDGEAEHARQEDVRRDQSRVVRRRHVSK